MAEHRQTDETVRLRCTVSNARRIDSRTVFALVDVEVELAGGAVGVQARREPDGRTAVALPTFKDHGGAWRPAVRLPDEVRRPLGDAVLAFLLEEGIARWRYDVT